MRRKYRGWARALGALLVVATGCMVMLALAAPRVICRLEDARQMKAVADIKAIVSVLERFRREHGSLPTTAQGLEPLVNPDSDAYLLNVPVDPWWRPYVYASDGQSYSVVSYGADGIAGGEGDDADIDDSFAFAGTPN